MFARIIKLFLQFLCTGWVSVLKIVIRLPTRFSQNRIKKRDRNFTKTTTTLWEKRERTNWCDSHLVSSLVIFARAQVRARVFHLWELCRGSGGHFASCVHDIARSLRAIFFSFKSTWRACAPYNRVYKIVIFIQSHLLLNTWFQSWA